MVDEENAFLLDVRRSDEFASGSVAGAKNIPLQALASRLDELPKDRKLVVFCLSGGRSGRALSLLQGAGFEAFNAGGLSDIAKAF